MNQELQHGFVDATARTLPVAARIACALGIIAFLLFGVVDLWATDDPPLVALYSVRAVVLGLLGIIIALTYIDRAGRWASWLVAVAYLVIGYGVIVVTVLVGGAESTYHEALFLTMFGFALLPLAWNISLHAVLNASLVLGWVIAVVATGTTHSPARMASVTAMLALAAIVSTTLAGFSRRLRERDFVQQATIAEANVRLSALDRAKSRFFANLSHEFRTPLTLALAPLESLLEGTDGGLSAMQERHVQLARRSALRLLRLVDDLLTLSRLEAASLPMQMRGVELAGHVSGLIEESIPLAARKGVELVWEAPNEPIKVSADLDAVERIFLNLLANALAFTRSGGKVTVRLRRAGNQALLEVIDTGIGIPEDQLDRIFERFHQVHDSTTAARVGTGIGLSLVRELVEIHHGTIRATSVLGEGTTMTVRLPLALEDVAAPELRQSTSWAAVSSTEDPAAAVPGELPALLTSGSTSTPTGLPEWHDAVRRSPEYRLMGIDVATERRRTPRASVDDGRLATVLVIEDNVDLVRFVGEVLSVRYSVMSATDGASGLRLAHQFVPDLILCDLMMPEVSGFDVITQLRASPATRHIPVIVLSARQDVDSRTLARTRGADGFLGKPFQVSELLASVSSLLDRLGSRRDYERRESVELAHGLASVLTRVLSGYTAGLRAEVSALQRSGVAATAPGRLDAALGGLERVVDRLGMVGMAETEPPELVSVDELVRTAIEGVPRPEGGQVRATLQAHATLWLRAESVRRALHELIENAWVFAGSRAVVHVSTELTADGDLVIRVEDSGPGIPRDQRERVFQPFFTTRPADRSGLGLTIARDVARVHAGTLLVADGRAGDGAQFVLRVPAIVDQRVEEE